MQLIETDYWEIVALLLLSQQPHILNETSIICLGIIGFLSAPLLCASVEQHAEDALPFTVHSPNGQFVQEAEHQRAGRRPK